MCHATGKALFPFCPLPPDQTRRLSRTPLPSRSGPDPLYSRGLRLVDDPLQILSAPPAIFQRHSTPPPGKTATKDGSLGVSRTRGGSGWFSFSLYQINSHYTKKNTALPVGSLASVLKYSLTIDLNGLFGLNGTLLLGSCLADHLTTALQWRRSAHIAAILAKPGSGTSVTVIQPPSQEF